MKSALSILLIAMICLVIEVPAQDKDLTRKLKGFDSFVEQVMKDWKVQGLAVAIVQKNKIVYIKGYGYRDVEKKLPVTSETLFAIGSCSKAFTAAAVCLLQEDGKLDLDKPAQDYIPELKLHDEYVSAHITPRDLLCHRSGLPRHDLVWYGATDSREELFKKLRYLELSKPFRSTFQYQNLMFMTAGYLVEELSGKSWEAFTKERIFTPLQMTSSNFSISDMTKAKDYSLGYAEYQDNIQVIPYRNIDAIGPAGSINSNVKDMSSWVLALINGGKFKGEKVFSESTIREIQKPVMTTPAQVPLQYTENSYGNYGLGWFINSYRGHVRVEHGGNIDGFSANTCFMPYDSVGVVVLTNMNGTAAASIIKNNVLDRMLGLNILDWNKRLLDEAKKAKESQAKANKDKEADRVGGTKPSHPLSSYGGKFEHPAYGILQISVNNDSLFADLHSLTTPLRHYHYDVFEATSDRYFQGAKISFLSNVKGEIDQLLIKVEPALKELAFMRKLEVQNVEASALALYVGEYDFGGQTAKVFTKGDKTLMLFVPGQPEYELLPIKAHEFKIKILDGFNIRFEVSAEGRVTEMLSIQPNGTFRAKRK